VNYKREYRKQYLGAMGVSNEAELREKNKSSSSIDMDTVVIDPKKRWDDDDTRGVKFVDSEDSEESSGGEEIYR